MAFLDTVMVKQISQEARRVTPGRAARAASLALLTALGWLLFGIGWFIRKTVIAIWLTATWGYTAIRVGWQAAGPTPPRKT